jgi:hypothetical protein
MVYPRSLGAGSGKYGYCEVCRKHVDAIYITPVKKGADYLFGHKECLKGKENG